MVDAPVRVTFYGVRGSTPCAGEDLTRYGGQTSCVVVEHAGKPIVLDLGTGFRSYGCQVAEVTTEPFSADVLLSHSHWDHVQGLPFFAPLIDHRTTLDIYGPGDCGRSFPEIIPEFMCPPFFPVTPRDLPATIAFHDITDTDIGLGDVKVRARTVPHTGQTNGYRIDLHGVSIAFVPDHQEPVDRPRHVDDAVLELCDDVDLLIHDAQYTPQMLAERPDWGHCTARYALAVAEAAGAKQLALFHHDPSHDDQTVDAITEATAAAVRQPDLEVFAAAEGLTLSLGIT